MGLVQSGGAILRQISFSVISEAMVMRVRTAAFDAILRQPVGWFDVSTATGQRTKPRWPAKTPAPGAQHAHA